MVDHRRTQQAMIDTAGEAPPTVVSELFGVCLTVTHSWRLLAQINWAAYLATRHDPDDMAVKHLAGGDHQ
ncbi:hypothetical protein [Nocardia africana]